MFERIHYILFSIISIFYVLFILIINKDFHEYSKKSKLKRRLIYTGVYFLSLIGFISPMKYYESKYSKNFIDLKREEHDIINEKYREMSFIKENYKINNLKIIKNQLNEEQKNLLVQTLTNLNDIALHKNITYNNVKECLEILDNSTYENDSEKNEIGLIRFMMLEKFSKINERRERGHATCYMGSSRKTVGNYTKNKIIYKMQYLEKIIASKVIEPDLTRKIIENFRKDLLWIPSYEEYKPYMNAFDILLQRGIINEDEIEAIINQQRDNHKPPTEEQLFKMKIEAKLAEFEKNLEN